MKAEIVALGTELLMGELTDTNSAWLAARLPALGIERERASMIGDNLATGQITLTRNIKTMGLSEVAVNERIAEFFGRENPYMGIYSKADGIHLRMIARAPDVMAA